MTNSASQRRIPLARPGSEADKARMDEILKASRPYGMIKEIEELIGTVTAVNATCVIKERELLLAKLEDKISIVTEDLESYKASPDIRNQALKPLQDIKKQVQDELSIPNMHYQLNQADDAVDNSVEIIEKAVEQPKTGGAGPSQIPSKPIKIVIAAGSATKTYLETEQDVNDYLGAVRIEIMSAFNNGMRVRIK